MRNTFKWLGLLLITAVTFVACTKDLDRKPKYGNTAASLYVNLDGYRSVLAKVYGGLALTGNSGPDGQGDIAGIDEGFSSYIRQYWSAQELTTDEAVIGWNDATIKDFHNLSWSPADVFIRALYSRIYFQITLANEFIRESAPEKLAERNLSEDRQGWHVHDRRTAPALGCGAERAIGRRRAPVVSHQHGALDLLKEG